MLVLGTAFLNTYQPFYLIDKLGQPRPGFRTLIFQGMLAQTVAIMAASILGGRTVGWTASQDLRGRSARAVYAIGLWVIAIAADYPTFLSA